MKLMKTEAGQRVLKDRSVPLTPRQRSAFILFDGKRSVAEVLAATAGMGLTNEDVEYMVQLELLVQVPGSGSAVKPASAPAAAVPAPAIPAAAEKPVAPKSDRSSQQRYQDAYPIATKLTAGLGLRGFRLNLAVESAGSYELLCELAPKIKDAVGPEKFTPLQQALYG